MWLAVLLAYGELIRVPEPLYRKRYGPTSVHAGWLRGAPADVAAAWVTHCVQILDVALECDLDPPCARELTQLALARALGLTPSATPLRRDVLGAVESAWLLARFLADHTAAGLPTAACSPPDPVDGVPSFALRTDLDRAEREATQLRATVAQQQSELDALRRRVRGLRDQLDRLTESRSWRLTQPLRTGAAQFRDRLR